MRQIINTFQHQPFGNQTPNTWLQMNYKCSLGLKTVRLKESQGGTLSQLETWRIKWWSWGLMQLAILSWPKANKSCDHQFAAVDTVGSLWFQAHIPSSGSYGLWLYRAKLTATKVVRISPYAVHSHTQGLCHPGQRETFISTFISVTVSETQGSQFSVLLFISSPCYSLKMHFIFLLFHKLT